MSKILEIALGIVTSIGGLLDVGAIATLERKWGKKEGADRIPWSQAIDFGITVKIDVDARQTPALAYENWLQKRVIGRIPGGR